MLASQIHSGEMREPQLPTKNLSTDLQQIQVNSQFGFLASSTTSQRIVSGAAPDVHQNYIPHPTPARYGGASPHPRSQPLPVV